MNAFSKIFIYEPSVYPVFSKYRTSKTQKFFFSLFTATRSPTRGRARAALLKNTTRKFFLVIRASRKIFSILSRPLLIDNRHVRVTKNAGGKRV